MSATQTQKPDLETLFAELGKSARRIEELERRVQALEDRLTRRAPSAEGKREIVTAAYTEGRRAYAKGLHYFSNPFPISRPEHSDWHLGWEDAEQGVSPEFRMEAEKNGERR